jgi:putative transcription antitermination factor YqgF
MGLAVADDATGVVTPLRVVAYTGVRHAARTIQSFAVKQRTDRVVVGLPCGADGTPTPACRRSQALARELATLGLDVALQSEYLSTNEARRRARSAGLAAHQAIDHLAAQVILEEYLGDC